LFVGGQAVVGVVGACGWCGRAGEGVADDGFVAVGDEEDADGVGVVVGFAQAVVDEGDVGAEQADVSRFEPADLELDDDLAQVVDVEEQQVDDEFVAVDGEADLAADEGRAVPELEQGVRQLVRQGLFHVAFVGASGQAEVDEDVGAAHQL